MFVVATACVVTNFFSVRGTMVGRVIGCASAYPFFANADRLLFFFFFPLSSLRKIWTPSCCVRFSLPAAAEQL